MLKLLDSNNCKQNPSGLDCLPLTFSFICTYKYTFKTLTRTISVFPSYTAVATDNYLVKYQSTEALVFYYHPNGTWFDPRHRKQFSKMPHVL